MVERGHFKREHGARERARQQAGSQLQYFPPWKIWKLRRDVGGWCCLARLTPPSITSWMEVSGCSPRLETRHLASSIPRWLSERLGWGILSSCSRNPPRDLDVIGLWWGALGMDIFKKLSKDFNLQPGLGTTGESGWGLYRRSPGEAWTQPGWGESRSWGLLGRSVVKVERMSINNNNKIKCLLAARGCPFSPHPFFHLIYSQTAVF